jgi:hypothetical protein
MREPFGNARSLTKRPTHDASANPQMSSRRVTVSAPGPLDLLEESIRLLRSNPTALGVYLVGTLPFVVSLLYFLADMSRSAFAADHCAVGSIALGWVFLWMKAAHGVFGALLLERVRNEAPKPWTSQRLLRIGLVQAALQPWGLIVLPAPLIGGILPFIADNERLLSVSLGLVGLGLGLTMGWSYAFFQGVSVVADRCDGVARAAASDAWRQACLWPIQNHSGLGLLGLFGLFVYLNASIAILTVPALLKLLLGIESDFTLSPQSVFNTTFFSTALALAWLTLDPIAKAYYVLRTFRGESMTTGADLRAQLRLLEKSRGIVLLLMLLCLNAPSTIAAAEADSPSRSELHAPTSTSAVLNESKAMTNPMDQALDDVLNRRTYTWREPRDHPSADANQSQDWLTRLIKQMEQSLQGSLQRIGRAFFQFIDWLILRRLKPTGGGNTSLFDWTAGLDVVLYGLLAVGLAVLGYQAYRVWRRREISPVLEAALATTVPDLRDEQTTADQLPEDGWIRLAQELTGRGELRLALRALYLASLASLAHRELVTLEKHKSNRDYLREFERRARAFPGLQGAFHSVVATVDRTWYGTHEVTPTNFAEFDENVRTLLTQKP